MPLKVDRRGRRFGFVKFRKVENFEKLEKSLEEVWMGGCRVKVNKARFEREEKRVEREERGKAPIEGKERRVSKEVSFKLVLAGPSVFKVAAVQHQIDLFPTEERLKDLENCFVAVLRCHREAQQVQHSCVMEGVNNVKVMPMGDEMVLLRPEDPSSFLQAAKDHEPWRNSMFKEVTKWSPKSVVLKRRVWLKFSDVSTHVWEEESFKVLGSCFGKFVDFDEDTVSMKRIDVARILVSTTRMDWINESLTIHVIGATFVLWVVEEGTAAPVADRFQMVAAWEAASSASSHGGGRPLPEVDVFSEEEDEVGPRRDVDVCLGEAGGTSILGSSFVVNGQLICQNGTFA